MKTVLKNSAFTLLEVIIAITVFSIFIGFVVSAYLSFHRADQEVLVDRNLMMEGQQVMDALIADIKSNKIDYAYYEDLSGCSGPFGLCNALGDDHALNEFILALRSLDGSIRTVYEWDSSEEVSTLTVQKFDVTDALNPVELDAYAEPVSMTSDHVYLKDVNFRIFPDTDPYDSANATDDSVAFQPVVTLNLLFAAEGRVRDEVMLALQTTVTSRFYQ